MTGISYANLSRDTRIFYISTDFQIKISLNLHEIFLKILLMIAIFEFFFHIQQ